MTFRIFLAILGILFSSSFVTAQAGEEGLYDPLPPKGAAFVRFVNNSATSITPSAGGKTFAAVNANSVSPYYVVTSGTVGDKAVVAGEFYTVAAGKAQIDPKVTDATKSLIVFYNLTDKPSLTLKTADGKIAVVDKIGSGANGARAINPLNVNFAVYEADKKIADVTTTAIERGRVYSVFAVNDGANIKTIWNKATTKTK